MGGNPIIGRYVRLSSSRCKDTASTSFTMNRSSMTWVQGPIGLFVLASVVGAQLAAGQAPTAAWSSGVAYDSARARVVVFGGYSRGYVGGTWEWDGSRWTRPTDSGPSARNAPALAYDAARRRVVLFGGDRGSEGALADTWVYDGKQWKQIVTPGPSARSIHAMVYDTRRGRVVLFGGVTDGRTLNDTWEWDGIAWKRVATTGPAPRALHGLAYDPVRGRTVLFGGQTVLAPDQPSLDDTWEWDGAVWTRIEASPPGPRDHVAMAADPRTGAVLLHGVRAGGEGQGETWSYDGHAWTRLAESGPRRGGGKLLFNASAGALQLYGGGDGAPTNELWTWNGASWEPVR